MKRVGNLMEQICRFDNLQHAFLKAARGKTFRPEVIEWRRDVDSRLLEMRQQLMNGTFRWGEYHYFKIHDPKPRTICAARFDERVAAHAMMRVCHEVFDRRQIDSSCASRPGRGIDFAVALTSREAARHSWFAKLDMVKYFDSIDHRVLMGQLQRLIKDRVLLRQFEKIINSYHTAPGRGLPIGNLTSQYFANHYLAVADRYMQQQCGCPSIIRYMDDVVIFADEKDVVLEYARRYRDYVGEHLRLDTHDVIVNRTRCGVPFVGYVISNAAIRLNSKSRRRYRDKRRQVINSQRCGIYSEREAAMRLACLNAFVKRATGALRFLHTVAMEQRNVSSGF